MMEYSRDDIKRMLLAEGADKERLFADAAETKRKYVGNVTYLRGLVEYSNVCAKSCLYCGIRSGNTNVQRYTLDTVPIMEAARFAMAKGYGSIVLQGGEIFTAEHIATIEIILLKIKELSHGELGVTLSLGEQTLETYQRWFAAGAHRYLLRIESSDRQLYNKLHPQNKLHDYDTRIQALRNLRIAGYQVGTGVMIGVPFQTIDNLVDDIQFFRSMDIDMCGMGPYVEHRDTPLYEYRDMLQPIEWRMEMTLKMIAVLRVVMPKVNIAATTALEAIDPQGRTRALKVGANIIMPNITPGIVRDNYKLYEGKPSPGDNLESYGAAINELVERAGDVVGYGKWGDSLHFGEKRDENSKKSIPL